MGKYDVKLDMTQQNDSHAILLKMIPRNSRVLEFGPAAGAMTQYMKESLKCEVFIVENDKDFYDAAMKFAVDGYCGNIENHEWLDKFETQHFDVIMFADVLEHLVDPEKALRTSKQFLKPEGKFLISLPNIAHSAIIIDLMRNHFDYREEGLLDRTHLKHFSYFTAIEMFSRLNLVTTVETATYLFPSQTEMRNDYTLLPPGVEKFLLDKEYGTVYQFIFECLDATHAQMYKEKFSKKKLLRDIKASSDLKIYFEYNGSLDENNTLQVPIWFGNNHIVHDVGGYESSRIRIDFGDRPCMVTINHVTINDAPYPIGNIIGNNNYQISNHLLFEHNDPYIFISIPHVIIRFIDITFRLEPFEAIERDILDEHRNMVEKSNNAVAERDSVITERDNAIAERDNVIAERDSGLNEIERFKEHNQAAILQYTAKIDKLEQMLAIVRTDYNSVIRSTSWRATAPVRSIISRLRAIKRPLQKSFREPEGNEDIKYSIDECRLKDGEFLLIGWVFSPNSSISALNLVLQYKGQNYKSTIPYGLPRMDVYDIFKVNNSRFCGFKNICTIDNMYGFTASIECVHSDKKIIIPLGRFSNSATDRLRFYLQMSGKAKTAFSLLKNGRINELINAAKKPRITDNVMEAEFNNVDLGELIKNTVLDDYVVNDEIYTFEIDLIIPCYNGLQFYEALFSSIKKTKMKTNLIIVDDASPDKNASDYLEQLANREDSVTLLKNENNLGFVKSVNKAFSMCKNHVVLLNTDIELPDQWLERLIAPIVFDDMVASSTPFTTCGTICSFPNFLADNPSFLDLSVNETDSAFKKIIPSYVDIPTGVGFCMGINKDAIKSVGLFDDEAFVKGYGEENDWCQRAIKAGYRNVFVENLFVYHKHGGSFLSNEKKQLIENNYNILLKKHPNYEKDIWKYIELNPHKGLRDLIAMSLISQVGGSGVLIFDHAIGGGANSYSKLFKERTANNRPVMSITYGAQNTFYRLEYTYRDYAYRFKLCNLRDLSIIAEKFNISEIYINELVTYPDLFATLEYIKEFKEQTKAKMIFLCHDFYPICPTVCLINDKKRFCGIPELKVCDGCIKNNMLNVYNDYSSMKRWRVCWIDFLACCDEIRTFSENTKTIYLKAYESLSNINVVPHVVDYITPVNKPNKTTNSINIGFIGSIGFIKGSDIVNEMGRIVDRQSLNVKLVLIGTSEGQITAKNVTETGRYKVENLPDMIIENDIDIVFIPSICPETFSYVTEEAIQMGLPVACFDVGAPSERVAHYKQGLVISKIDAQTAVNEILRFIQHRSGK